MFEVIQEALIWIMSWMLDRRPHGGEALRLLLLIAITGVATWLSLYWRDLAYRSSAMRRRLLPEERYAGRYLQAIWRSGKVRYAIVNIYYNGRKRRFEVAGRNYSPAGDEVSSFRSAYVLFPSDSDNFIEFIWQGSGASTGYTRMALEDSDEDYVEGEGHMVTLHARPDTYPIRFKKLHDRYVRPALGVNSPAHPFEEPAFIRKFNKMYGASVEEGFADSREMAA
jgi:hypothetical protein